MKILISGLEVNTLRYNKGPEFALYRIYFDRIAGSLKTGLFEKTVTVLEEVSRICIDEHFDFEENIVFPALMQNVEYLSLVERLSREHNSIRLLRDVIQKSLQGGKNSTVLTNVFVKDILRLFKDLEAHARKELEVIVPWCSKEGKFTIAKSYLAKRTELKSRVTTSKLKS